VRLTEAGCRVISTTHPLSSISRSSQPQFSGNNLLEIATEAFRRLSSGVKISINCVIMAADVGAVPADEDIVAIVATGRDPDSAIVLWGANQS
jgi:hypothetical protein